MDLLKLLNSLTIEEKIGQLVMISPYFFLKDTKTEIAGPLSDLGISEEEIFLGGSVLGIGNATEMIEVQKRYLERSRHKIPLIFMADIIHGYETIFPIPLALSNSWNDDILYKTARTAAVEASTSGIHVTFAPMVDLVRDPRWGRVMEAFGEDPYINKRFAKQQVLGFQNKDISKDGNIAACVKHFAAYGAAEAGKDYNTVDMSRLNLHQYYMTGYKSAVEAGAKLVMTSFNIFEGVPATTNKYLLKDVLRNDWKFNGVIISDYESLKETLVHATSENEYEAAVDGIKSSLDIEMASAFYIRNLKKAIENKDVTIDEIDEAVLRVLKLKQEAGLFENPFKGASLIKEKELVRHQKHLELAKEVSDETIVMLKNDGIFPLKKLKTALIGNFSNNPYFNGNWSWHGDIHRNKTIYEVLKDKFEINYFVDGFNVDYEALKEVDQIIIACGEDQLLSGEARSRSSIKLPDNQEEIINEIKKQTNKPIGLILFNGRPLDLTAIVNNVNGILDAFFPGSMGAFSIVDILIGKVNPSGKLTMSFPRSVGQVPIYYNYLNTGRPITKTDEYKSFYKDIESTPLFPFGYGLSYSNFEYSNLRLSKTEMKMNEKIKVSIDVYNNSNIKGKETIQLYIRDMVAKVARPVKELKNFVKVEFNSFEKKTIEFEITKQDLEYIGQDLLPRVDNGDFEVFIGSSSSNLLSNKFKLIREDIG